MNKVESKGRIFPIGILAAVFIALTVLGACNTAFVPDGSADQATVPASVDAAGLVEVRVALPSASGGDARSVTNELVPVHANYYEVIFKVNGSAEYYFASAEAGKEYLSISVKPDVAYDILLLAGTKANRVLLATGFVNDDDGTTGTNGGLGYTVKFGQANVISPTMHKTNITPDSGGTPDITFKGHQSVADDLTFVYARGSDNIAIVTVPSSPVSQSLIVHLLTTKFVDLANAGAGTLAFSSNKAMLNARYTKGDQSIAMYSVDGVDATTEYTYTFNPLSTMVKAADIDGKVRLELTYYAFGDPDSKSSLWNIRNGLDYDVDDNGSGGSIVVQFGDGSPLTQDVTIDFLLQ
jgi:hypothetical protein